jgi:hypothetical protein
MVQIIYEEVYADGFEFLLQDSDIDVADGCLLSVGIQAIRSCCGDVFPHR